MTAILVFQNNETAATLVYQTNVVGVQLFSYVNTFFYTFFCPDKFTCMATGAHFLKVTKSFCTQKGIKNLEQYDCRAVSFIYL